jgi:heme-degrading monooxygenase HmoA
MISRIWHGWATRANADKYEKLLRGEFLPGLHRIRGYTGAYLMRRDAPNDEVEFVTITQFTDIDAVKHFAGEDYERAQYYPEDDEFLVERTEFVQHHVVRTSQMGGVS